jgi:hypothetical protein
MRWTHCFARRAAQCVRSSRVVLIPRRWDQVLSTVVVRAKAGAADVNARLMDGFTDAEIDIVSRWLTAVQTKFPKGDDE